MSTEDLTEEILTNLEPVHGQPALRHPVRSESVPRPRHKAAANPDGHSLLQLPPDIPDFNDSGDAEHDTTDSDSSSSEDNASSSVEETKGKPDVDTEETKPRIPELREIFDQLRIITDTGTEILSLLKEVKAPDHQPSPQMSPSSKMSIEAPTKSPHESTACGSDDGEDDSEISGPDYFVCLHCEIPRSTCLQYDGGVCAYCYEEQRFCVHGGHEAAITDFVDCDGIMHDICSECRGKGKSEAVITDLVDFDRIKSEDFNGCRVKGESEVVIDGLVDFDHFKKEFYNESKVKEEI